jgi:dolichol-phosphate mannosyltransferase
MSSELKFRNTFLVSIVIPCYNEEGNIELLYSKIRESLTEHEIELIFIDDNSSAKTLDILEELSVRDPSVRFLSFSRNFGHQSALRAGLQYATGD